MRHSAQYPLADPPNFEARPVVREKDRGLNSPVSSGRNVMVRCIAWPPLSIYPNCNSPPSPPSVRLATLILCQMRPGCLSLTTAMITNICFCFHTHYSFTTQMIPTWLPKEYFGLSTTR